MSDESELERIADKTGVNEVVYSRYVGTLGAAGLIAVPLVGWVAALYSTAVGVGLLGRYLLRKKARQAYKARKALNRIRRDRERRDDELLRKYA